MNPANTNLPHLAELPVRGIVKAARIVTNVVAQPGDFYAGMRRRWLLHLGELTFKSEGSLSYRFSLVLLGGRGIVEATGVVGNAIAPCCKMSARITHIIMSALRIDKKKTSQSLPKLCDVPLRPERVRGSRITSSADTLTLWGHPEEVHGAAHLEPIVDTQ